MVLAKDREIKGLGMQNFRYNADYEEFMRLIQMISPRAYRTISLEFKAPAPRASKYVAFPSGSILKFTIY